MELLTQKTVKTIFFPKSVFTVLLALVTVFACEVEEPVPTYTLTTSVTPSEGGKISVSPQKSNYVKGSQLILTPEPNENWVFKQWEGDATGSTTPLQLTLTANKNVVGVFVKRDYPLTIKIEGEGTVEEKIVSNPSGREYPHGTTVELTPKPKVGWEFEGWSGDLSGNESPKRITVDKQKNVTAKFKETSIFLTKKSILINSTKFSPSNVESTMRIVSGAFIYKDSNGNIFSFHPGNPVLTGISQPYSIENVPPTSSQILKKVNGEWFHFKEDERALFWGARNFKIMGDRVVVSDANELGVNPFPSWDKQWRGNILFGKILNGGNIDWVTVNKPEDMGYFHGVTMGDLNKDGLLDIGGTPGRWRPETGYDLDIFYQESINQFKFIDNSIPSDGNSFGVPFTLEFEDLFGDSRAEIITASYGGSTPPAANDTDIRVFSFDDQTSKYVQRFKANNPSAYTSGMGATSIKVFDVNKDGIKDITVAREGYANGLNLAGFEVWLGKVNGTYQFSFSSPTWTERELQFREFVVLDANNDGLDDIILIPFHAGSLFITQPCGPSSCTSIKLNHLIWLNKGDGTFQNYSKTPIVIPGVRVSYLLPYKEGNKLFFVGTNHPGNTTLSYEFDIFDIRVNIDQ
jgi:uncharacterized repeat protein (TIGR02543 family)